MRVLVTLRNRQRKPAAVDVREDLFDSRAAERMQANEKALAREWWVIEADEPSVAVEAAAAWPAERGGAKVVEHFKGGSFYTRGTA